MPLTQTPAAVRFLSCEPLLGPVDLRPKAVPAYKMLSRFYGSGDFDASGSQPEAERMPLFPPVQWVIIGGESGPNARDCDVAWLYSIVNQCRAHAVPVFVKQLGAQPVIANDSYSEAWPGASKPLADDYEPAYQGEIAPLSLCDRKGGDVSEWPDYLRIREFPQAVA